MGVNIKKRVSELFWLWISIAVGVAFLLGVFLAVAAIDRLVPGQIFSSLVTTVSGRANIEITVSSVRASDSVGEERFRGNFGSVRQLSGILEHNGFQLQFGESEPGTEGCRDGEVFTYTSRGFFDLYTSNIWIYTNDDCLVEKVLYADRSNF